MATFHIRAARADREGYYYTRWDQSIPLEVTATTKAEALTNAEAILGPPPRGRYWTYKVDRITTGAP